MNGAASDDGTALRLATTMRTSPAGVAAGLPDRGPRLLRQFSAFFLVTPDGEVWRVFDSDETGANREAPSRDPHTPARVFLASEKDDIARIYRFRDAESRVPDALLLFEQLKAGAPCDTGT